MTLNYCARGRARIALGDWVYVCEHRDRPCEGIKGPGRCDRCDRMKVKR